MRELSWGQKQVFQLYSSKYAGTRVRDCLNGGQVVVFHCILESGLAVSGCESRRP